MRVTACGSIREVGEINHAGYCQTRAFSADRGDQPFGLGQRQAADAVDLLGDDDLARLQVSNHAQQFGTVSACAGRLLAIDAGDVMACLTGAVLDVGLAGKVLFVGADTQVKSGYLHVVDG